MVFQDVAFFFHVALFLLLSPLPLPSSAQLGQSSIIVASNAAERDGFGFASAASGNLMVVGAPYRDTSSFSNVGAAYLFNCTSFPCTQLTMLTPSATGVGERFGFSVAISGTRVVVGSPNRALSPLIDAGAVSLFSCASFPCTKITLTPSDPTSDALFGQSVAISGNMVAVGAPYISGTPDKGAVYVYHCPSSCSFVSKVTVAGTTLFGSSVAMDSSTGWLLVGASSSDSNKGRAYLYFCTTVSCVLGFTFVPLNGTPLYFGASVAIRGDTVVIGAHGSPNLSPGTVYVFKCLSYDSCTQQSKLTAPNNPPEGYFGKSVTFSNSIVVVGAPAEYFNSSITESGSAYVFDCWYFPCSFITKLVASDPMSSDLLGTSLAMIGWKVAAGVYFDDVIFPDQGSVKIFDPTSDICKCSLKGSVVASCDFLSRQCTCKAGWTGLSCETDINECTTGTHNCDLSTYCTNTQGSFTCTCRSGYQRPWNQRNETSCSDINECTYSYSNNCHEKANCTNTAGSFTCTCKPGYSGNGTSCSDVDECVLGQDTCSPQAECINIDGSFFCGCNSGYFGDGFDCQKCHFSCKTCFGAASDQCLSCRYGFYSSQRHTCDLCLPAEYHDESFCLDCDSSCATCSGGPNNCTSCKPSTFLSNGTCKACQYMCLICADDSPGTCLSCDHSSEEVWLFDAGNCVFHQCSKPNSFIINETCFDCHPTCATCTGPSARECSTCAASLVLSEGSLCVSPPSLPGFGLSAGALAGIVAGSAGGFLMLLGGVILLILFRVGFKGRKGTNPSAIELNGATR